MDNRVSPELLISELKKEIEMLKQELAVACAEHDHSLQIYNNNATGQNNINQELPENAPGNHNHLYRSIVETANEGIWVFDVNCKTIFVNKRTTEIFGYGKDEMLGKHPWDFMPPESIDAGKINFEKHLQGNINRYEHLYKRKDGSILWTNIAASLLFDAQGKVEGVLNMITDITKQKLTEQALYESREQYRLLFDSIDEGYCVIEMRIEPGKPLDYRFIEVNQAFEEQSTLADAKGKWMREMRPDHEETWFEIYRDVALTGKPVRFELGGRALQNRFFSLYAFRIGTPEQRRVAVLFKDNTAQKALEEALRENEEKFSAAFRVSPHALILSKIEDGTIIETNNAFNALFGWSNQEALGKSTIDLNLYKNPDDRKLAIKILKRDERVNNLEIIVRDKYGTEKLIVLSIELIHTKKANLMLSTFQDVTEQKKSDLKIRELLQLSERRTAELTAVIESMPEAVYIGNKEGITHCNQVALKMLGAASLEDLQERIGELGKKFNIRWPHSGTPLHENELQFSRALQGETVIEEVVATNAQTGKDVYIRAADAPIIVNGEIIGAVAINSDITERKEAEEALRTSEAQLDAFFANSPAILNLVDGNFCYINTDKVTPTYYGLTRETIKGKCVPDLSPDFMDQTGNVMRHVIETGESILNEPFESPVPGRNGEMAYWRTSFFRVPLGDEKWGVGVIGIEVTDIKRSELKLSESEKRFHTLADNISQFAWMADVNGSIFWYNKRWYDYTGTTFEEMKGWGWTKIHHPDHVHRVMSNFKKAIDKGENWEDTFPIRGRDNVYRWYLSRALPIRNENNDIIRWFGTNTDITEQKLAEEKLHAALLEAEEGKNTLNTLMEYIPMGITIADAPDVNIRMVSKYGQGILEKSDEEIAGIPAPEHPSKWGIYRADGLTPATPEELPLSRATMMGEIVKNEEWIVTRKDGTLVPILCNAAPILNNDGKVAGGVIGWQDIADLKRIEFEMKQRNEELTRFIYTVSHDLKSPLVTIKMFTTYLRDDIKNNEKVEQENDLNYIENAADKMGKLLDELLELSRIGRKEQFKTEVSLEVIIQNAVDMVAGRIRENNVEIVVTAPPLLIFGFYQRLIQLFQNLLDNAAKFMGDQPAPLVEIGAITDKSKEIILFVRDNGSGIDPRYHDKLFGLFEKLDPAAEGTGIGLALVKRIVEVHNGRIWFTSEGSGKGTTFYFTLEKIKLLNN